VGDRCLVAAFHTPDSEDACCAFIDTVSGERTAKHVRRLLGVHGPPGGAGDVCVLACELELSADAEQRLLLHQQQTVAADAAATPPLLHTTTTTTATYGGAAGALQHQHASPAAATAAPPPHTLVACDALGAPLASATVGLRPDYVAVTESLTVAASSSTDAVAVWQFDSGDTNSVMLALDPESGDAVLLPPNAALPSPVYGHAVTAVAAAGDCVLAGRESGAVDRYRWEPPATLAHVARYTLRCRPAALRLNCDASCFGVIDDGSVASIFDMTADAATAAPAAAPAAGSGGSSRAAAPSLDTSEALPPPPPHGQHLPQEWPDAWVSRTIVARAPHRTRGGVSQLAHSTCRAVHHHVCPTHPLQALLWSDDAPDTWCVAVKGHLVTAKGAVPNEPVPR
jgi:hypothetical protein